MPETLSLDEPWPWGRNGGDEVGGDLELGYQLCEVRDRVFYSALPHQVVSTCCDPVLVCPLSYKSPSLSTLQLSFDWLVYVVQCNKPIHCFHRCQVHRVVISEVNKNDTKYPHSSLVLFCTFCFILFAPLASTGRTATFLADDVCNLPHFRK